MYLVRFYLLLLRSGQISTTSAIAVRKSYLVDMVNRQLLNDTSATAVLPRRAIGAPYIDSERVPQARDTLEDACEAIDPNSVPH